MSAIVSGIGETVKGLVDTVLGVVQAILNTIIGALSTAGDLGRHAVSFVVSNIIPIGVVIALLVAWSAMQQRRGNITGGSATRAKLQKKRA